VGPSGNQIDIITGERHLSAQEGSDGPRSNDSYFQGSASSLMLKSGSAGFAF